MGGLPRNGWPTPANFYEVIVHSAFGLINAASPHRNLEPMVNESQLNFEKHKTDWSIGFKLGIKLD